ncbi:hypothetical protein AD949_03400 [Acetobacter orleanensis]|nr:hypothetical protein AD949_03400 [Acetobacter orleanensis]
MLARSIAGWSAIILPRRSTAARAHSTDASSGTHVRSSHPSASRSAAALPAATSSSPIIAVAIFAPPGSANP